MKLYRFSPIKNKDELLQAIRHIHFECCGLCKQAFSRYLKNAGNMGIFCHYNEEYDTLIKLRKEMTEASDNIGQKYFRLYEPIIIPAQGDVPETTYTYLYIRKPDPYRHHVGDIDFYLEPDKYAELKQSLKEGNEVQGMRIMDRADLDMIELYDPDVDALAYVSTNDMSERVRVKLSNVTKL